MSKHEVRPTTNPPAAPTARTQPIILSYIALARPRQWVKNGAVLAGLFFSEKLDRAASIEQSLAATAAFCLVSSAVYCVNDIADRAADASHPEKRNRPLASGALQPRDATIAAVVLVLGAAAIVTVSGLAWQVPVIMAGYLVLNVAYSLWLKHLALLDVVVIASGFVLRLVAGTYAVGVPPSSWIVLCTGLLSLFLALGKRRGDLEREGIAERPSLDGYTIAFIDQALGMMAAATVVVYALFTVSDYAQFRFHAEALYLTTFPVVVGILRYLQVVVVQGVYGSPADIVLRDRPLQLIGAIWLGLFALFVYA
jgi:4-hydroxybenzoate polyprenyltransferase